MVDRRGPPTHEELRTRAAGSRRGFTYVELVVVLLVIAIMAAAAAPRYADSLARARVDMAARRVAAELATAQSRARATSSSQTVTFTLPPNGSLLQIVGMTDPDRPERAYTVNFQGHPYQAVFDSVELGGDPTLVFNGYGIPDSPGKIVIRAGRHLRTITVEAGSGWVTVQ